MILPIATAHGQVIIKVGADFTVAPASTYNVMCSGGGSGGQYVPAGKYTVPPPLAEAASMALPIASVHFV